MMMWCVWAACLGLSQAAGPHILFVVSDDLGFNDVSFHGSEVQTPFLDSLVKDGVHLANYYGHHICTPSRSALMTGRYAFHTGLQHSYIEYGQDVGLPLKFQTLGNHFQKLGYHTIAIGKWHLGMQSWAYTPTERGFNSYYGYLGGGENYWTHEASGALDLRREKEAERNATGEYSTGLFVNQTIDYLKNYKGNDPLFIYLAFQAVHDPLQVPKNYEDRYDWIKNSKRRTLAGMATCMDDNLKRLVDEMKNLDLWKDTITAFTADNGGPPYVANSNWPMRGGKWTLWEGGTHLAAFLHAPGRVPAGKNFTGLMHMVDWLPTLYAAAGGKLNDTVQPPPDGVNMWPSLINPTALDGPRTEVALNVDPVLNDPHGWSGYSGIRVGNWKLLLGDPGIPNSWCWPNQVNTTVLSVDNVMMSSSSSSAPTHPLNNSIPKDSGLTCNFGGGVIPNNTRNPILFDLLHDPEERYDVAAANPQRVATLTAALRKYIATAVEPLNGTPESRKTDPKANPKNFGGVWTPWQ